MSATRLLVLGVVRGYGRAHGYLIGTDLLSWGADEWANVKWGSIYHALKQLTKTEMLWASRAGEGPAKTEYELSALGEDEFVRLLEDALQRPDHRPDMLSAGLAMLPALSRRRALTLLERRLLALEEERATADRLVAGWAEPPHVQELYRFWSHTAAGGAEWTRGLLARLHAGAYAMAGEPDSPGEPGSWPDLRPE
ncbi:MAG: PadR family transcriptional regulator [Propionibacteriales bacterium]|nr:PadR family transcriptional regulator [Propionibacteriales bacterium]